MIKVRDTVEQLVEIYLTQEWWHKDKLSNEEAVKYHKKRLDDGNILIYEEMGEVLGYVEFWRLNYEQWGRVVCHEPFGFQEDIVNNTDVCYVANTWIHPDHRRGNAVKILKIDFFRKNYDCKYFVGHALRKKTQPIKILTKQRILERYVLKGDDNG